MPYDWDQCIIEGKKSFDYMITHFYEMFDETTVKDFYIGYDTKIISRYYQDIHKKYGNNIQVELIPWIHTEFEERRLFEEKHWKPFRECDSHNSMYLGYIKLFQYKRYYFQLIIESGCKCDECIPINKCGYLPHFELLLYGWNDNDFEKIQPDNEFILVNNMIPEKYWIDDI